MKQMFETEIKEAKNWCKTNLEVNLNYDIGFKEILGHDIFILDGIKINPKKFNKIDNGEQIARIIHELIEFDIRKKHHPELLSMFGILIPPHYIAEYVEHVFRQEIGITPCKSGSPNYNEIKTDYAKDIDRKAEIFLKKFYRELS